MNENDSDIYTKAAAYLYKHPEELEDTIRYPDSFIGGPLFFNAGKSLYSYRKLDHGWLGNPIMIRTYDDYVAETKSLTNRIKNDDRLPKSVEDCNLSHLIVLMEWQRTFDRMFKRSHKITIIDESEMVDSSELELEDIKEASEHIDALTNNNCLEKTQATNIGEDRLSEISGDL